MKRRALVLVDETARHPFRQNLPPYIRNPGPALAGRRNWPSLGLHDWRGFLAVYCAAFLVVSIFIA